MEKMTFSKAFLRLKEISDILDNEDIIDLDKLLKLQDEANALQDYCQKKLNDSEKKLNKN